MHCVKEIQDNIFWVGGNDRRIERFENMFPLPGGIAYNSYLIMDEKTALMDTSDAAITQQFLENILFVLGGRTLDYLIINHMEPDHCANIQELLYRYPALKIVGSAKTFQLIDQFYNVEQQNYRYEVKEGQELSLGQHTLQFIFAPMVHWPEVLFTYEKSKKILFSADAFGAFGAIPGNLFADEVNFERDWLDETRRYYFNIVGRYGKQVENALVKVETLPIDMICPLHGLVWRKNTQYPLNKYRAWSRYIPEEKGVVLCYASMYGNTENLVDIFASGLAERGVKNLRVYDVSKTHPSYMIADAFKYSHMVLGSPTYNNGLYFGMQTLLEEMARLNMQNRKAALVGNGSWAPSAIERMSELVLSMPHMELLGEPLLIRSSLKEAQLPALAQLIDTVAASVLDE